MKLTLPKSLTVKAVKCGQYLTRDLSKLESMGHAELAAVNSQNQTPPHDAETHRSYWRVLSASSDVVAEGPYGNPVVLDFSHAGGKALQEAVKKGLLTGAMVTVNHSHNIVDWAGTVAGAAWSEGKGSATGGIDAAYDIDLVKDQSTGRHLARGIDKGAIRATSLGFNFDYEKSHPKMEDEAFLTSQGQVIEGQVVRLLVKKINEVHETSLVWQGADREALKHDRKPPSLMDAGLQKPNTQGADSMKNLAAKLKTALNLPEEPSEENIEVLLAEARKNWTTELLKNSQAELAKTKAELEAANKKAEELAGKINASAELIKAGEGYIDHLRKEAVRLYNLAMGDKARKEVIAALEASKDFENLKAQRDAYGEIADARLGKITNGSRQSSSNDAPPEGDKKPVPALQKSAGSFAGRLFGSEE